MISPAGIIQKKRDAKELTQEELKDFIQGVSSGEIPEYQASAFLMAVYFRGMSLNETVALTEAMLESGDQYVLDHIPGVKVDKHSTGGVGDKVSLILAPLAAACGLKVPMMAGRGLGHSGGTLDKLEAITGFNVHLDRAQFEETLRKTGCAIIGQTQKIAPADRKLYALRDVTATVECIPLIVASILSKKLAEGTQALVLDVKTGNGAFMKTREQARKLAKALVQVSKKMNLPCRALITNMNQPLGYAVGNALEVQESIEILKNIKRDDLCSADLKELTIHLCAHMLEIGGISRNVREGRKLAVSRLTNGSAWNVFQDLVKAQGGTLQESAPFGLPQAQKIQIWKAKKKGYIGQMNAENLGKILIELGGGRKKVSDKVDPSVGMVFHKKLGSRVQINEPIATVYAQENTPLDSIEDLFHRSIDIKGTRKPVPKLIFEQYSWK